MSFVCDLRRRRRPLVTVAVKEVLAARRAEAACQRSGASPKRLEVCLVHTGSFGSVDALIWDALPFESAAERRRAA